MASSRVNRAHAHTHIQMKSPRWYKWFKEDNGNEVIASGVLCYQWNYINVIVTAFCCFNSFFSFSSAQLNALSFFPFTRILSSLQMVSIRFFSHFLRFFRICLSLHLVHSFIRMFNIIHLDLVHSRIKSIQFRMKCLNACDFIKLCIAKHVKWVRSWKKKFSAQLEVLYMLRE